MFNRFSNIAIKLLNINRKGKSVMAVSSDLIKIPQEPNEAVVVHDAAKDSVTVTLKYTYPVINSIKLFNFNRKAGEHYSLLLNRISEKISRLWFQKLQSKKEKPVDSDVDAVNVSVELQPRFENSELPQDASCLDILINSGNSYYLKIEDTLYYLNVNPPILTTLKLPKDNIMAGFLLYPAKLEGLHFSLSDSKFAWFKSREKFDSVQEANCKSKSWEKFGDTFCIATSYEDIGRLLKVECIPYQGDREGIKSEAVASVLVSAGPGRCPFDNRHRFTKEILGNESLRLVSYNILAELYSDSNHSRKNLFPTCPPYALAMDYRKQLLIKEILGYNADVICLQEVDKKVFDRDLQAVFSVSGLQGKFKRKGGQVAEGTAIFYRSDKLGLEEEICYVLQEELQQNSLFSDILEIVLQNEVVFNTISTRPTILQACVFIDKNEPSRVIVAGTTHLHFDPISDHIRLIQAWICLSLLQQIVEMKKIKYPGSNVSLIFSGDFNSTPENAVYRLMTSQFVGEDDADWTSKPEEHLKGTSLSHGMEIESACGTPPYTNYTVGFNGCLDYIFYQADHLTLSQVVPLPTHDEVTAHGALPSVTIPSDHLALVADFKWKT